MNLIEIGKTRGIRYIRIPCCTTNASSTTTSINSLQLYMPLHSKLQLLFAASDLPLLLPRSCNPHKLTRRTFKGKSSHVVSMKSQPIKESAAQEKRPNIRHLRPQTISNTDCLSQLGLASFQLLLGLIQSFPLGLEDLVVFLEGCLQQLKIHLLNHGKNSGSCGPAFAERKAAIAPEKP